MVKQRMSELGYEHQIEEYKESGNITLLVKLEKKRMLKVTLQSRKMESVKQQLSNLEEHINAINQIPMNYRIYFQSPKTDWKKESDSKS